MISPVFIRWGRLSPTAEPSHRGGPSVGRNEEIFLPSAAHGDRPLVPAARHYVPVPICFVRKRGLIPVGSLASLQLTPGWKDGARSAERFDSYPERIKPVTAKAGSCPCEARSRIGKWMQRVEVGTGGTVPALRITVPPDEERRAG